MSIRVCILEDDKIVRDGMAELVNQSDECFLVGTYETAEELMKQFNIINPDVVLVDIRLPGRSGIDCIRELKSRYPEIKTQFLVCSVYKDNENIFDALCAGATGYIVKSDGMKHLIESIKEIHRGESPMSGVIARQVIAAFQNRKTKDEYLQLLTEREREILDFLSRGHRYKEISSRLSVSLETIRTHIHNIYEKLQVSSRTDALNKVFGK